MSDLVWTGRGRQAGIREEGCEKKFYLTEIQTNT
jgi:hypothetical protein